MAERKHGILLAYPPISKMERYGSDLGVFGGSQIPLGLYYLAAFVRDRGWRCKAIDAEATNATYEDIIRMMAEGDFDILGISSTTVAFHRALELASAVKAARPGTIVIIGGPHVSTQPAHPLQFDAFDYAVRNEGELTLAELLDVIEQNGDPAGVAGLTYRRNGEVVVNPPREYIADLDTLPFPAYDMIPDMQLYSPPPLNYRRRPVANIITARGCPNDCTFCENTTFGRRCRMRSAESVVDEIEMLIRKYGVREISFVDDTFTVKPKRIYEIFDIARARGLQFPWSCMSRVNTVDEKLLTYMRDNGCWYIGFGIESGNEDILKVIKKKIRLADVERVVRICDKLGIVTKGFFIIGHPMETEQTINETISFACRIPLNHVVVTINTPMPGTEQYANAKQYGTLDVSDWNEFNYWKPVFVPKGLTPELLLAKQKQFIRKFYVRPSNLWRQGRFIFSSSANIRQMGQVIGGSLKYLWKKRGKTRQHPAAERSRAQQ